MDGSMCFCVISSNFVIIASMYHPPNVFIIRNISFHLKEQALKKGHIFIGMSINIWHQHIWYLTNWLQDRFWYLTTPNNPHHSNDKAWSTLCEEVTPVSFSYIFYWKLISVSFTLQRKLLSMGPLLKHPFSLKSIDLGISTFKKWFIEHMYLNKTKQSQPYIFIW